MSPKRPLRFDPIAEARRQWEVRGWGAPASMAAATSIMRAQQLVLAGVEAALREFDLTFARYEALVLLRFSREGRLPLGKMGERLMVHPTSITNAIDRLEEQGLVRRVPHPEDRRAILAEITPVGVDLVERATQAVVEAEFGLGDLSEAEADRLTREIRKMRRAAGDFED